MRLLPLALRRPCSFDPVKCRCPHSRHCVFLRGAESKLPLMPVCCPLSDFDALNEEDVVKNNQLAFDVAEQEFGIPPVTTGKEVGSAGEPDKLSMVMYLSKFYELFRGTPLRAVGKPKPDRSQFLQVWGVEALHAGSLQAVLLSQEPFPS